MKKKLVNLEKNLCLTKKTILTRVLFGIECPGDWSQLITNKVQIRSAILDILSLGMLALTTATYGLKYTAAICSEFS